MIILITGIILILVSFACSKRYSAYVGFAFIFLIMGFQSNVKGDFYEYMEAFQFIQNSGNPESIPHYDDEPFMTLLMQLFSWCPWWLFVMCLSLFQTAVLSKFVNKYTDKPYRFISAILFFFTFNMMLLQMKAMRQGLAVEILILAFMLIENKKTIWISIILLALAFFTHNSSIVMAPFLLLYWVILHKPGIIEGVGNFTIFPMIILGVYILLYIVRNVFLVDYFSQYLLLLDIGDGRFDAYVSGKNTEQSLEYVMVDVPKRVLFINGVIITVLAWFFRKADPRMRFFTMVSIVSIYVDLLFGNVGTLARLVMYFSFFNIIVFPNVATRLHRKYGPLFSSLFIVMIFYQAWLSSSGWLLLPTYDHYRFYQFVFLQ